METPGDLRLPKIPTEARRFGRVVLALMSCAGVALAQSAKPAAEAPLSEVDVIRLARTVAPAAAVARASDELAEARARTAALLENPRVSWARETVETGPAAGQGSQDVLIASLPVDIARPLATRSLMASENAWMRAEAALSHTDAVLDAVLTYYAVVLAERRVEVLSQALSNLEEAARVLARREAAGAASGYESIRLSIASELGRSHLAEARGGVESAKARLGPLLGVDPAALRVASELSLISASDETRLARGRGAARPALQQASESLRRAREAEDRAAWSWLPALELSAGVKRQSNLDADSGYGYAAGVSLGVPLFDHGQALSAQARAQRALATARSEALTRSIDAGVQSALATFRAARQELSRFESQTAGQVQALLAAAQSGYREGERTIVELLDAERAQTDVAERRLSLLETAKRAEAALRAAAGDLQ